jgi:hypothetical protein
MYPEYVLHNFLAKQNLIGMNLLGKKSYIFITVKSKKLLLQLQTSVTVFVSHVC